MYKVFKVVDGENLFSMIPSRKKTIEHPRIENFTIQKNVNSIIATAKEFVPSIFSPEGQSFPDEIKIDVIISQYQFVYSIVELSGRGLMTIGSYDKYIKDNILKQLLHHFKNTYNLNVEFKQFEFENAHFSKKYWGDSVKSQKAYISSERMHINLSSLNFYDLIKKFPEFEKYFTTGTIKYIKGVSPELVNDTHGKHETGIFRFERNGMFHCNLSDIEIFNNFIMKLIDKKFFNLVKDDS
jgi:hypothetical protein